MTACLPAAATTTDWLPPVPCPALRCPGLQTDAFVPLIADAPGLPCKVGIEVNSDSSKIKFGTIRNCETGVWITTQDPGHTVM